MPSRNNEQKCAIWGIYLNATGSTKVEAFVIESRLEIKVLALLAESVLSLAVLSATLQSGQSGVARMRRHHRVECSTLSSIVLVLGAS